MKDGRLIVSSEIKPSTTIPQHSSLVIPSRSLQPKQPVDSQKQQRYFEGLYNYVCNSTTSKHIKVYRLSYFTCASTHCIYCGPVLHGIHETSQRATGKGSQRREVSFSISSPSSRSRGQMLAVEYWQRHQFFKLLIYDFRHLFLFSSDKQNRLKQSSCWSQTAWEGGNFRCQGILFSYRNWKAASLGVKTATAPSIYMIGRPSKY